MRCYYEVLGVQQTADLSELKKGYYKASLKWHPDKNPIPEATAKFQEIQEAYRVLSDAQERAWYDRHRDQILRGGSDGSGDDYKEERVDVFKFFSRSCFTTFDDGPQGFYTVFKKVFEDIADEEIRAGGDLDGDGDFSSYPTFGSLSSDYEAVVRPFYTFWEGFSSKKSYTWVEKYDTRFMSSRFERRAAEADNRRLREAARRCRNEEVRNLVRHVRRLDPRVAAERDRVAEAARSAHARTREMASMARRRNAADLEQEWAHQVATGGLAAQWEDDFEARLAEIEAELGDDFLLLSDYDDSEEEDENDDGSEVQEETPPDEAVVEDEEEEVEEEEEEESEEEQVEWKCEACGKSFTSALAKQSHDASKNHRKQLQMLQKQQAKKGGSAAKPCAQVKGASKDQEEVSQTAKKGRRRKQRNVESEEGAEAADAVPDATEPVAVASEDAEEITVVGPPTKQTQSQPQSSIQEAVCQICQRKFPSKNKLFAHIKETGHAVLKTDPQPNKPRKSNKRGK